jgi:hypothetical protein
MQQKGKNIFKHGKSPESESVRFLGFSTYLVLRLGWVWKVI